MLPREMAAREVTPAIRTAALEHAPRLRATRALLGIALAVALAHVPVSADAVILYQAGVGFRQPEFFVYEGDQLEPQKIDLPEFSFGGSLCPAPGTPNFLCGRLLSEAGNSGGRLFLRSTARFKRTNAADTTPETAAYADTRITITEMGGYVGTAPAAAFYFGLSGTLSKTASHPNVVVQAFSVATLYAGSQHFVQCFSDVDCTPEPSVEKVMVTDWDPSFGFSLILRSDVAAVAQFGTPSGWDAEVVADFSDTLEILAIQVLDENGDAMKDVHLTALDGNGDPVVEFPNEAPAPEPGQALLVTTGAVVWAAMHRSRRAA
jgi:hypothetical protein